MLGFRAFWFTLTLLLGCATQRSGPATQSAVHPSAQQTPATAPPGLFLYAVEREGHASYVLGTIHLGFGFEEVLTPKARAAFAQATLVVTEADITGDASERLLRAALLPADQSLATLLDAETFQALQARLESQLPAPVLPRLKPWLPAVLLGLIELNHTLAAVRPNAEHHAMDLEVVEQAKLRGVPLKHLETMDEQIAVFESVPLAEQISELHRALTEDSAAQSRALVEAFGRGDEHALEMAVFEADQLTEAPGFYQAVLFDRNTRWLPVLEQAFQEQTTFVAVGVAHLLGQHGLLAALSQHGYNVKRIH